MPYFRYRTALYGAGQLWYGIYDHNAKENLRRLGSLFLTERKHCDVAIYQDYHNKCVNKVERFEEDDTQTIFLALNRQNIHADFISGEDDFGKYKVVIFPHVTVADDALAERIRQFTDNGDIAILSARGSVKDKNVHYRPTTPPGIFRNLAGCRVEWFTTTVPYEQQYVQFAGQKYLAETYYEVLSPEGGKAVGSYTEDFCAGKAGVVKNGNVYYIGFFCRESAGLYADIIRRHVPCPAIVDPDLEEIPLSSCTMYLNHGDRSVPLCGYDLIKEQHTDAVPPYGAVLIRREG